jgi:hypothetical protein
MPFVREPRKLPVILSPEEVARFLEAAPGLKYRAALSVAQPALGPRRAPAQRHLASNGQGQTHIARAFLCSAHMIRRRSALFPAEAVSSRLAAGTRRATKGTADAEL